jgi:potassium-dependent mechanosensitive channel
MNIEQQERSGGGIVTCAGVLLARRCAWLWAAGRGLTLGLILFTGLVLAQLTALQPKPGTAAAPATNRPPVLSATLDLTSQFKIKLTEAQDELNRVLTSTGDPRNLPPGATASEAIEYRSLLQRLVRTYQVHMDEMSALEASRQRQEELDRTIRAWSGFSEPPPYSVLLADDLRDSIQSLNARIKAAEVTRDVVEKFLDEAQAAVKASDEVLRRLGEQSEGVKDPEVTIRLAWQRQLEQIRVRVAAATAASFETRRRMTLAELAEARQRLAFAQRRLALVVQNIRFSQADLDKALADLGAEQQRLEEEIQVAEAGLDARQKALVQAREAVRKANEAQAGASAPDPTVRRLHEELDLRDLECQTGVQMVSVLRQLLDGLGTERQMWQTRFAVADSLDLSEIQQANQKLTRLSELIKVAKPYYLQQLQLTANFIAEEQKRLLGQDGGLVDPALARQRIQSYEQREMICRRALQGLERRARTVDRWQETIEFSRKSLSLWGRVRDLFTETSTFLKKLWNFEVFVAEDTITVDGQPITGRRGVTLGKIALAVFILAVGYWISNLLAGMLERVARQRLKVEPNQANLIRRWVRVVLVICLLVFSLVSVKIPLTIFAFAGGALAIGVGFGTQNLLKNFISGIVILFERPFRVGDVLAVGGHTGLVTSIGIRSSVIQLWDSTETLIPNSALLENNLTNWTYSNGNVRFSVTVGVAYGSDTRRVSTLLAEIADRHGLVEKDPKPQVLFMDFCDSALTFELRYWVNVLKHNAAQIASDLRHMINGTFTAEGIVIAFPQRDVNLRAVRPIEVQVMPRSTGLGAPAQQPNPASALSIDSAGNHEPSETRSIPGKEPL